jgi:predicted RNase H-like nuclease (RuvC/YqgF family)
METERIAKLEAQVEGIKDDVKDLKADVKEVHSRITTGNREIMDKIDTMDKSLTAKMAINSTTATEQHEVIQKEIREDIDKIAKRVDILEKWRWMIVGGAIALGYVVGHMEIFSKFFSK